MAKKINMSAVKEYLFQHGEKVALGTCVFLALLFGGIGLMRALSAGRADNSANSWDKELEQKRKAIASMRDSVPGAEFSAEMKAKMEPDFYVLREHKSKHNQSQYYYFSSTDEQKRVNPPALGIKAGEANIRLDYISGLVWIHKKNEANNALLGLALGEGAGPGGPGVVGPGIGGGPGVGSKGMKNENKGELPPYLKAARAERMILVTAIFPMKLQVEEFQRALKLTQAEMFTGDRNDLPKPLGINVLRYEVVNNQRIPESEKVILKYSDKFVHKKLDDLLKIAFYDEEQPEILKAWLFEGLHTPLPRLANAKYPKTKLPGFKIAWGEEKEKPEIARGGENPMPPVGGSKLPGFKDKGPMVGGGNPAAGAGAADRKLDLIPKAKLAKHDQPLYDRLFASPNKYNIYHVLGHFEETMPAEKQKDFGFPKQKDMKNTATGGYFRAWDIALEEEGEEGDGEKKPPVGPPGKLGPLGPKGGPMGDGPGLGGSAVKNWDRDALVRFIDVDVTPGKTYQYAIWVTLENPNSGKKDKVAFAQLAEVRELHSKVEFTPTKTIPDEHFLYAIDQHQLDEWVQKGKVVKKAGPDPYKLDKDEITFQIHQWEKKLGVSRANETQFDIGDWAIAEWIKVRRGDSIGKEALVKVPVWREKKDDFEVPHLIKEEVLPRRNPKVYDSKPGFHTDFIKRDADRPVLVDFTGGKRLKGPGVPVEEDVAVEALLISADGMLKVLNSRTDSESRERRDRVETARDRVREILNRTAADPTPDSKQKLPGGGKTP